MFCPKCGNEISENEQFCVNCGFKVSKQPAEQSAETAAPDVVPEAVENAELKPVKKSKKKAIIIAIVAAVVVIALAVVAILMINGGAGSERDEDGKRETHTSVVENYLDFLAKNSYDAEKYITDGYMGGEFGSFYGGDSQFELHSAYFEQMVKERVRDMYGYGSNEISDWKDFIESSSIEQMYRYINNKYGSWELEYDIINAEELSADAVEKCEDVIEDMAEETYDGLVEASSGTVRKEALKFKEKLEDADVKKAYEVEVEIKIYGEKDSYDQTKTFTVAKVDDDWIILDGPAYYEFCR